MVKVIVRICHGCVDCVSIDIDGFTSYENWADGSDKYHSLDSMVKGEIML